MTTSQPRTMANTLLTFLIPSLIGVFLFMVPIPWDGQIKISVAILADMLRQALAPIASTLLLVIISMTGLLSLLMTLIQPRSLFEKPMIRHLFLVTPTWLVVRLVGMVFVVMTYFQLGPKAIYSDATGAFVLTELLPLLLTVFILAGFLLPLLLNFGLLELVGTLFTKIMKPLFGVPGRSAVNCAASWLGDGSVGILMTARQYEEKHYTQKEAAIIGTTFSAVSITFCFVVIGQVRLEHLFAPFYLTVCLAGVVCALILPRIPPLSLKKNIYVDGTSQCDDNEAVPQNKSLWRQSLDMALDKARHAKGVKGTVEEGLHNALDMVFAVLPVVMAVGTFALIVSEYTPVFQWLGKPFIPYLELLGVPEAVKASETIVVGFADMFIPSILAASNIDSEVTRFIIAAMSVTQLIYMSEVGALLLGSKIPVNILELFAIFILRTLISLPVITLMANWLVA
ncbi:YjiH family protein [Pseudoalteromonas sp. T1lg75]|uniref:YjiH family protein n=1 Tax=Pseudoalteromonas sp. T1lg75 TaxID=2077102 RepID=UPI000CF616D8|nr:YjiH family protein [Pseudoalteromonas sp. T1lg75]